MNILCGAESLREWLLLGVMRNQGPPRLGRAAAYRAATDGPLMYRMNNSGAVQPSAAPSETPSSPATNRTGFSFLDGRKRQPFRAAISAPMAWVSFTPADVAAVRSVQKRPAIIGDGQRNIPSDAGVDLRLGGMWLAHPAAEHSREGYELPVRIKGPERHASPQKVRPIRHDIHLKRCI